MAQAAPHSGIPQDARRDVDGRLYNGRSVRRNKNRRRKPTLDASVYRGWKDRHGSGPAAVVIQLQARGS